MIKIDLLTPDIHEQYDQFLSGHPAALLYHSNQYKDFLKSLLKCNVHYLVAIQNNNIVGALPLMYINADNERKIYNSLPFYGSNGGILANNEAAFEKLLHAYNEIAKDEKTVCSNIINNPFQNKTMPEVIHNYTDYRIGQISDISYNKDVDDELFKRIDSSARRNVKKASREGVIVEIDNHQLNKLCDMHRTNIRAIGGLPKSSDFFQLIPKHFSPHKDYNVFVARKDGQIIAALLLFYFNKIVEYFTPAVDPEFRSSQPLALIIMEAMVYAAYKNYKWWNWGGTWESQVGVYRFKKKWGAIDKRYNYYIQLNDRNILDLTQTDIIRKFPNFYIIPFKELHSVKQGEMNE